MSADSAKVTLRLRSKKVVKWDEDVVDNETLGRKKSKKCCIFHKRRRFGESSSESEGYSSSSGGETDPSIRRHSRRQDECNCRATSDLANSSENFQSAAFSRRRPFTQRPQEQELCTPPMDGTATAAERWKANAIMGSDEEGTSPAE